MYNLVAAIFYVVYPASRSCTPTLTPSVHLAVRSPFQQIPYVAVTEAVCGTHIPRAMRIRITKRAGNTSRTHD